MKWVYYKVYAQEPTNQALGCSNEIQFSSCWPQLGALGLLLSLVGAIADDTKQNLSGHQSWLVDHSNWLTVIKQWWFSSPVIIRFSNVSILLQFSSGSKLKMWFIRIFLINSCKPYSYFQVVPKLFLCSVQLLCYRNSAGMTSKNEDFHCFIEIFDNLSHIKFSMIGYYSIFFFLTPSSVI